jgi:hypothetical protein
MADASRNWTRRHSNGWIASVTLKDDRYSYLATSTNEALPAGRVRDLKTAQGLADDIVPPHGCSVPPCEPWSEKR